MFKNPFYRGKNVLQEVHVGFTRILRVCPYSFTVFRADAINVAFLGRDNVLEVALGLIIGAAFSNVVTSLVSDIILPPISLLSEASRLLESRFLILRHGLTKHAIYNTIEQAADDGTS